MLNYLKGVWMYLKFVGAGRHPDNLCERVYTKKEMPWMSWG